MENSHPWMMPVAMETTTAMWVRPCCFFLQFVAQSFAMADVHLEEQDEGSNYKESSRREWTMGWPIDGSFAGCQKPER
jgi:hypothetical protein